MSAVTLLGVASIIRLSSSRIGALLALGALGVHELRYRVGFGEAAQEVLRAHGHDYLTVGGPLVGVLAALVLGRGVALWAGGRSAPVDARWRLTALWPALALALAAIFSVQELLEGVLASGHPSGVAAVLAGGGWVAFAAAGAIGSVLALVVRFAERIASDRPCAPLPDPSTPGESTLWCLPTGPGTPPVRSPASARGPPLPV